MKTCSLGQITSGMKLIINGDPCIVTENEFVKPGKGQAFNRLKYRNLKTGRVIETTYKSGESLVLADIVDISAQFLYQDGEEWHFMSMETFEQYALKSSVLAEAKNWLADQAECKLTLWNDVPIAVSPPIFVYLAVIETDPGVKGNTVAGGSKLAKLSSGAMIKVPLFVQVGDRIKVDTRVGKYVSRTEE